MAWSALCACAVAMALACVAAMALAAAGEAGYSRSVTPGLLARYERTFGSGARGRLEGWKAHIAGVRQAAPGAGDAGEPGVLQPVNAFFNRIPAATDASLWGAAEYWATPAETLAIHGADCEDYAIAKYYALKELGIPVRRLRMVYVRQRLSPEAHMVLAYYSDPRADPLILDNLDGTIAPASRRPDLTPVYSFNDDDMLVLRPDGVEVRVDNYSHRTWKELLEKLKRELTY